MSNDLYKIKKLLSTKNGTYTYYSLAELQKQGYGIDKLPFSIRILLENASIPPTPQATTPMPFTIGV